MRKKSIIKIIKEPSQITNHELADELWKRGYYVMKIEQPNKEDADYLVVSSHPPCQKLTALDGMN